MLCSGRRRPPRGLEVASGERLPVEPCPLQASCRQCAARLHGTRRRVTTPYPKVQRGRPQGHHRVDRGQPMSWAGRKTLRGAGGAGPALTGQAPTQHARAQPPAPLRTRRPGPAYTHTRDSGAPSAFRRGSAVPISTNRSRTTTSNTPTVAVSSMLSVATSPALRLEQPPCTAPSSLRDLQLWLVLRLRGLPGLAIPWNIPERGSRSMAAARDRPGASLAPHPASHTPAEPRPAEDPVSVLYMEGCTSTRLV